MDILSYRAEAAAQAGNEEQQHLYYEAIGFLTLLKRKGLIDNENLPEEVVEYLSHKKPIKLKLLSGLDMEILDQRTKITNLHYRLLSCLLNSPNYAAPSEHIAKALYGDETSNKFKDDQKRIVAVVFYLNEKLKKAGILQENLIEGVWGWGYKLNVDPIKA